MTPRFGHLGRFDLDLGLGGMAGPEALGSQSCALEMRFHQFSAPDVPERRHNL